MDKKPEKLIHIFMLMNWAFVILFICLIVAVVKSDQLSLVVNTDVEQLFDEYFNRSSNEKTLIANKVMKDNECCGWKSVQEMTRPATDKRLPLVCCINSVVPCVLGANNSFKVSCSEKFQELFKKDIISICILLSITLIFILFYIVILYIVFSTIRDIFSY